MFQFESEYVSDTYAKTLEQAFANLRRNYIDININAKIVATSFVNGTNEVNKKRFYSAMNEAIGINLQTVIQNEGLEDSLISSTNENVKLIKTIPQQYFDKIETIVFNGTMQGTRARSMISEIVEIGFSTSKRAKLIARDQTSKLNSALNRQRQENLGVEEYIWRTAGDDRVRDSHKRNNGKVFRWDDPPDETGHPGNGGIHRVAAREDRPFSAFPTVKIVRPKQLC